ncbi:hypothetical protein LPJ59_002884 [Coemansia sp. RSA 2399]|nr:hypothetical protein LPJ59_002884 [Coemansia sp. RSA 2399]
MQQPAPTFANTSWQNMLVIPPAPKGPKMSTSPAMDVKRDITGDAAAAMELGLVSADDHLDLVRDLLPAEMLPTERQVQY